MKRIIAYGPVQDAQVRVGCSGFKVGTMVEQHLDKFRRVFGSCGCVEYGG